MKLDRLLRATRGSRSLLAVTFACLALSHAEAQCQSWTPGFSGPGADREVYALAVFDDGSGPELYAGGRFSLIGDASSTFIARFDGTQWSSVGSGMENVVRALCVFDDGGGPALYAGGSFHYAGGVPAAFVARWNGSSWSPLASGLDGDVNALAVYDDGSGPALYAGGVFGSASGTPAANIARWDGASWSALGAGIAGTVYALASFDGGSGAELYAAGTFPGAFGVPSRGIVRWNGAQWSALGSGLDNFGQALTTYDDGSGLALYVSGNFFDAGGVSAGSLARWNGSQWSAPSFSPFGGRTLYSIAGFDDGTGPAIYVGGSFYIPFVGMPAFNIARWNGSTWSAVGTGLFGPGALGLVDALTVFDDGSGARLCAGGSFVMEPGAPTLRNIASWKGAGWKPLGTDHGLDGEVHAFTTVEEFGAPRLAVAGLFVGAGGQPAGSVATWDGSAWASLGSELHGTVQALAEYDDGGGAGPQLYAGGTFDSASGSPDHIARWDGAHWVGVGGGTDGSVNDLVVSDVGSPGAPQLFAVGQFTTAGGVSALRAARWNGSSWSPLAASGVGTSIAAIVEHEDGGGRALYVASNASPRVWRWAGTTWSSLPLTTGNVRDLASFDPGTGPLLCATDEHLLHVWDGASWSVPPGTIGGDGYALHVFDDESGAGRALYIAARSTSPAGTSRIVRWDGASFSSLAGDLGALPVFALGSYDEGRGLGPALFVGGGFVSANGIAAHSIARWQGCSIRTFCAGDGLDPLVATPCPCANFGAPGSGCASAANAQGARLDVLGRIAPDSIVLQASGMSPTAASIFLKGESDNVVGAVFGDGLRCIDGPLIRLGLKTSAGGSASYPEAGDIPLSVRGQTPPGSGLVGYYQTYYRSAAPAFCTPATFNVTSAARIAW